MKIIIDVAHPAHIHYFRNLAEALSENGHSVLFTLRDKGIIVELAEKYKLNYKIRSKEKASKVIYFLSSIFKIFRIAYKFKPDLFLDMGTIAAAPVAKLLRKPYIAFDDTEVSTKARKLHMPFTDIVFTPDVFRVDLGKKHVRIKSVMELLYLNKKYFQPNKEKVKDVTLYNEKFVLLRFVSWEAHHDVGNSGISLENKCLLVERLAKEYKVIISSESELPEEFRKYQFMGNVQDIHHYLHFADLVITEGATMASEAVVLGTPTIYINTILNGYSEEQITYGLLLHIADDNSFMEQVMSFIKSTSNRSTIKAKYEKYIVSKINFTDFLIWYIPNYPESQHKIEQDHNYQLRYK